MSETTERRRYYMALRSEAQRQAFVHLANEGFQMGRAYSLCRNPRIYGLWSNFAELKEALITAGLWDRLYHVHDRSAAVG
jgi:hypothetical protein